MLNDIRGTIWAQSEYNYLVFGSTDILRFLAGGGEMEKVSE